jgi:hypothetical protein
VTKKSMKAIPTKRKRPLAKPATKKKVGRRKKARKATPLRSVATLEAALPSGGAAPLADGPNVVNQISTLAAASKIAKYGWLDLHNNKDKAPLAYIKGMAVVYARVYCKLKAGDAGAVVMAKKKTADSDHDVLAFYDSHFSAAGMKNDTDGPDTLRHLFVLMVGLGVQESSGRYCAGRYAEQGFSHAEDAEAGLFQASFNTTVGSPTILKNLFDHYAANPGTGFLDIFKAGIRCSPADWKNWGNPSKRGYQWQQLTKTCPAFAVEFAAVGLRTHRLTWDRRSGKDMSRSSPTATPY